MENKYLLEKNKKDCNGCGLCAKICPRNAISMVEDEEGFMYPVIDESKCIKCNKCYKTCSNFNNSSDTSKAYMAINKNKEELKSSSSGGMFYILAKYVINKKGVVFGVEYDENMVVCHNYAETLEECKKFQGSKYVRSDLKDSYEKVKEFLEKDRYVLFTGTPCQCQGLKIFLKKEYKKLIICDIICHSNPSPKVFKKYIEELENKNKKKIKNFYFRSKENGWRIQTPTIEFVDGKKKEESTYFEAFTVELLGRPCCHSCKFVGTNRVANFTIADLWGVEKIVKNLKDDDTGISLLLVNDEKGKEIFKDVQDNMEFQEIDIDEAFKYNHNSNVPTHKNREKFFSTIDENKIVKNMYKYSKKRIDKRIKKKVKRIIKKFI